jgi:hypothetical protein
MSPRRLFVNKKLTIAAPTFVAIVGIAIVSRMAAVDTELRAEVVSSPTPYSQDHARVQSRSGEAEPMPATF